MEKRKIQHISTLAFLISLIYTCRLMLSNVEGWFDQGLTLGMALVLELGKCVFLYIGLTSKNLSKPAKYIMTFIGVFLFLVSICASLSCLFNQANETYNKNIISSEIYKRKIQVINDLTTQRNNYAEDYIKTKADLTKQILELNEELKIEFPLRSTKGYTAFFEVITNWINKKETKEPLSTSKLQLLFFTIVSITFELVAIFLFYLHEKEKQAIASSSVEAVQSLASNSMAQNNYIEERVKKKEIEPILKPVLAETLKDNKIGFKYTESNKNKDDQKQEFSNEDMLNYLNYMLEDARKRESNISRGYKAIAKEINISEGEAFKIKNALELKEIIKSEGNQTIILKDKEDLNELKIKEAI